MVNTETAQALSLQGQDLCDRVRSIADIKTIEQFYLVYRFHYLKGDAAEMQALIAVHKALLNQAEPWFESLLALRLAIREKTEVPHNADRFNSIGCPAWRGEALMVYGMYLEERGQEAAAIEAYHKSAASFVVAAMHRKSLIAAYNELAAKTRLYPEKKYFFELRSFVNEARRLQCFDLSAVALANLSRDCQLVGAIELAKVHCEEALHYLKIYDFGSLQYFLTVAHYVNLLLQTGAWSEAVAYYEELSLCDFKEIKEIKDVIEAGIDGNAQSKSYAHLPFTWRERLNNFQLAPQYPFTDKERILIESLTESPKSIEELSAHIYGSRIDLQSSVGRTKQLVHRVRRKAPNLIAFQGGKYALV